MPIRAKEFRYAVELDGGGRFTSEDCEALVPGDSWTADHLLLAALVRCSIESFRHHARRVRSQVQASGSARGVVTRRDSDGRYAFVEIEVEIEAQVEPPQPEEVVADLVADGMRDCFVGASLVVKPSYRWRVNGTAF